jgi:hypothetical protein
MLSYNIVIPAFCIILIFIILLWTKKLSKKTLYFLDILNLLEANLVGYLIIYIVISSSDTMIGILCGVIVADVFSFTKSGKNTLNAKLVGNINTLAKLSICLPVPKKQGLSPIVGVGDLIFYSMIIMHSIKYQGISVGYISFLLILAGQTANILFISIIIRKNWYKGFPATLFPGVFFIAAALINNWL